MHSDRGIAATIGEIDAASDESQLRAGVLRAREAVATELHAHTPTLTLAAAWTWYVSGSVARDEAIPGSDVETLIALDDGVDDDSKTEALALAAGVHALLARCEL